MVRYETYRANAVEAPLLRRWVALGLTLSLLLHGGLFWYFTQKRVAVFTAPPDHTVSRIFSMKKVSIPAMPTEDRLKMPERSATLPKFAVPQEKPEIQEVHMAPQISEISKQLLNEKPKAELAAADNLAKLNAASRNSMDRELNSLAQSLIKDAPRMPRQPLLAVAGGKAGSGPGQGDSNIAISGLASVDDMLSHTGALRAGEKAAMPGGALFEYDQYQLLPEAQEALRKLALLIRTNPKATFSIEGHTDSFGAPDYNQKLSEKRAEAVKLWLVSTIGIAPERIQTRGFGNAKPIVPADRTMEEQAPNRRVEIVVKTNRR